MMTSFPPIHISAELVFPVGEFIPAGVPEAASVSIDFCREARMLAIVQINSHCYELGFTASSRLRRKGSEGKTA